MSETHYMIAGSHERPTGPECRCGAEWFGWGEACRRQLEDARLAATYTENEKKP